MDWTVMNHGSVVMFKPVSDQAKAWRDENIPVEDWAWLGEAFACEHRYAGNLVEGIIGDGMEVEFA